MAIKAGDILHVGNGVTIIDRIQTGGPGQVNVPVETVYELGNRKSVGKVYDLPDLTFSMESLDVSLEIEALLTGGTLPAANASLKLSDAKPLNIVSQIKAGRSTGTPNAVEASVGLPVLTLESMSYRFGLRDNATQQASLRGGAIFYSGGTTYVQEAAGTNTASQTVVSSFPAWLYKEDSGTGNRRALSVDIDGVTQLQGVDYTESSGAETAGAAIVTITMLKLVPVTSKIRLMYASPTAATYLPAVNEAVSATRPAAVRGRNIEIYLGDTAGGRLAANKLGMVQSVTVDYRVTLDNDEEFGNNRIVAQDFDVPTTTGSVDLKPTNPTELMTRIRKIADTATATEVTGALKQAVLPLDIVIKSPSTGAILKTLHVPDARFTVPGFEGRVEQKSTVTLNFESDAGELYVFNGARNAAL